MTTEVLKADVQITLLSSNTTSEYIPLQNQGTAPLDLSGWHLESTWNNSGDKARLRNAAGAAISSKCYGDQCQ